MFITNLFQHVFQLSDKPFPFYTKNLFLIIIFSCRVHPVYG